VGGGRGLVCQDITETFDHCGSCARSCSATDSACCSGSCIVFGNDNHCNSCQACSSNQKCCSTLSDPSIYTCALFSTEVHYCGDCIDCGSSTLNYTNPYCCNSTCHDIVNTIDDCGCGDVCSSTTEGCCSRTVGQPGICTNFTTPLNCGECNYDCFTSISFTGFNPNPVCCQNYSFPTNNGSSWYCADSNNDPNNCGECGRICELDEICLKGICRDNNVNSNCGTPYGSSVETACAGSTICCSLIVSPYKFSCDVPHNLDHDCGCVNFTSNCTALVPPPENNGPYYCCHGACQPSQFDCMD